MALTPGQEMVLRARALGTVLDIPSVLFSGVEAPAYHIMSHTLCIPTFAIEERRTNYINEILPNTARLLPQDIEQNHNFLGRLDMVVAAMKIAPFWFSHLTMGNQALVEEYRTVTAVLWGLGKIGLAPISLSGPAFMEGLKRYQVEGPMRERLIAGLRGFGQGAVESVTGGFAKRLAAFWIIGEVAVHGMQERQAMLAAEINRRFANGALSLDQLRRAIGDDATVPYVYFYRVKV